MAVKNKNGADTGASRAGTIVRYAPMHDQILPHLRKDIVENRWKSGERLSEPQLCKEFCVSRTPLRQALKTLEAEGLIRLVPHVGAVVTDPDAAEVGDTMDILIGLEQLAATRVAQLRNPDALCEIEKIYDDMRQAAKCNDASRYYHLNDDFHRSIVRSTGNRSLAELHEKVMWHVHRERHRANEVEPFTVESAESHGEIVQAILGHRAEDAGLAMRKHLEDISRLMLARRLVQSASLPATSAPRSKAKRAPAGKAARS